jgi:hypothetical protein
MMVTLGGKERSEQEFSTLLTQAGLRLTSVTPVAGSFFSVVRRFAVVEVECVFVASVEWLTDPHHRD